MEWLMMAVCEGVEGCVGVGDGQLWLRFGILDGTIEARLKPELEWIGPAAADTFCALKATTVTVLTCNMLASRDPSNSACDSLLGSLLILSLARLLPQSHFA